MDPPPPTEKTRVHIAFHSDVHGAMWKTNKLIQQRTLDDCEYRPLVFNLFLL